MTTPRSARRRVLLIGPMLGGVPGFVTSQGEVLADHLRREGHEAVVTSHHPGRALRLADSVQATVRLRRWADVVVVMVFSGPGFALADAQVATARALGLPIVLHLHGGNLPAFCERHPRWAERVLGAGRVVVAPSPYLSRELGRWADVRVIPNIIELDDYPHHPRDGVTPRLLWMRTFHPLYHPEMAVEVLARLREAHPGATLTMAGQEKGLGDDVRALVKARGLEGAVRFPGFLDAAGKRREFAAHDVFLNTNRVDNMPVSVVEAGAFGLPIVATDVGGVRDLVGGTSALLVPDEDVDAMVAAVESLLADPALAGRLSRGGRAVAERSGWPALAPEWDAVLDDAVRAADDGAPARPAGRDS